MAKDLLYRQWLEQKLKEAISNLDTDRGLMSHSSKLYKNLRKTIDDVLEVLEKHNGEEWLEPEDKTELETKIGLMLEANKPYLEDKINKGGLAEGRVPTTLKRRCMGAFSISCLVPKILDDEEQYDIPDNLRDPDDVEYTDRFHKYKQKVRYLAKKQTYTYKQKLQKLQKTDELTKEEFNALMDFMEPDKILTYKNDEDLCQKYPNLRIKLEMAIRATEKLQKLNQKKINDFIRSWAEETGEKSLEAAEKSAEKKGQKFTERKRKSALEKIMLVLKEKIKEFKDKDKLINKGDVLEQVARFTDLKMKVISNKRYDDLLHTNTLVKNLTVEDYEYMIKESRNKNDREFYKNLRDIRELEDAGIKHVREPYEKTYYKELEENLHTTYKKEFLGFKMGDFGFGGVTAFNAGYGANADSTNHILGFGKRGKARIGKVGFKLHDKRKIFTFSSGLVVGQVKAGGSVNSSYVYPAGDVTADGEASALKARAKLKFDTKYGGFSIGGNAAAGYTSGYAKSGVGNFIEKDEAGNETEVYGIYGKAGYAASVYKGTVGGTLNIWGLTISVSLSGYGAGIAGEIGGGISTGGASLTLAGALGIGAGLNININWSGLYKNIKNKFCESKLKKLIDSYKEKKKQLKNSKLELEKPEKRPRSKSEPLIEISEELSEESYSRSNSIVSNESKSSSSLKSSEESSSRKSSISGKESKSRSNSVLGNESGSRKSSIASNESKSSRKSNSRRSSISSSDSAISNSDDKEKTIKQEDKKVVNGKKKVKGKKEERTLTQKK